MKAEEVAKVVGYKPDELILENVLTMGPEHADFGEKIYCKVSWQGSLLDIEGVVNGKEILLTFTDDQVDELIKFWQSFESKRQPEVVE